MSYPNIGKLIGRDHTTVMNSMELISQKCNMDPLFKLEIEELKKEVVGTERPIIQHAIDMIENIKID
jgi:hypothetical protein